MLGSENLLRLFDSESAVQGCVVSLFEFVMPGK
jgi:hypothetical protein